MIKEDQSFAFNRRYLVCMILVFLCAVYIGLNFDDLYLIPKRIFLAYSAGFVCAIAVVCAGFYVMFRKSHKLTVMIVSGFIALLFFIFGFLRVYMVSSELKLKHDAVALGGYVCGVIKSDPVLSPTGKSLLFLLDVYSIEGGEGTQDFDESCLVKVCIPKEHNMAAEPKQGDAISGVFDSEFLNETTVEGGFDYNRYLLQNKIVYNGYMSRPEASMPLPQRDGIINALARTGYQIREKILNSVNNYNYGSDESALLKGILVGYNNEFTDELTENMKNAGIMHINSVSGMHTSYLFIAVGILLGLLRVPRRAAALITIPIMVLFAAVAQFSPSVNRAVVMTIFMLGAILLRRRNDSITALAVAAFLIVAENPYSLENVSFLLSFGATLGILVFYKPMESLKILRTEPKLHISRLKTVIYLCLNRIKRFVISSVCLTCSATLGLGYFMARFFGEIQWGSVFSNIFVFPLTAAAFLGGYFNFVVGMVLPGLADITARYIVNPSLWLIIKIAELFSKDWLRISVPCPPASFLIVYIFLCVAVYILLQQSKENKSKE